MRLHRSDCEYIQKSMRQVWKFTKVRATRLNFPELRMEIVQGLIYKAYNVLEDYLASNRDCQRAY